MNGQRVPLWTATVAGSVHKLVRADVTGDGRDEIIVAADTAVSVVDATNGKVLRTIDGDGQFVRTVAASDLDGDGKAEVVLSTDAVRAFHGDGKLAWEYRPLSDIVFGDVSVGDGRVYASYEPRGALALATPGPVSGVAIDGTTGSVLWQAAPEAPTELGFADAVWGAGQRAATFASADIPYADGHAVAYAWIGRGQTTGAPPLMFVEIRDGRTGDVLHTAPLGGPHGLNNWVTGPEGLIAGTTAAFRTFGADGQDAVMHASGTLEVAGFATAPNGERILAASMDGGMGTLPVSTLVSSTSHVNVTPSVGVVGGRELALADLDGDGRVEMVSLNFDARGADRTAGLHGSAYSSPFTAMRQFVVATVDAL